MSVLYSRPMAASIRLELQPQLASWNRADDLDRMRLAAYVGYASELAAPLLAASGEPLALELKVGLPTTHPLTKQRDLDNYLYPVVKGLGPDRFVAVFGYKRHQDHSTLAIGPTTHVEPDREPDLVVNPFGRYDIPEWQEQIRVACRRAGGLDPTGVGPVRLVVSWELTRGRTWTELWKPTIDALGPLLGTEARSSRPHGEARDGRITEVALHQTVTRVSENLGHRERWAMRISFWWET
jgi:hypothetical protein